jgi:dCTP deaminase
MRPSQFLLAHSQEVFNLPCDIACEYKLKSSLARAGLQHALAGWCDPGWHGSQLTLELFNHCRYHDLVLRPNMKIGQMVFFRCAPVPDHASYAAKGQYNGDTGAVGSQGVR